MPHEPHGTIIAEGAILDKPFKMSAYALKRCPGQVRFDFWFDNAVHVFNGNGDDVLNSIAIELARAISSILPPEVDQAA